MPISDLISLIESFGVHLSIRGSKLVVSSHGAVPPHAMQMVQNLKTEIIAFLSSQKPDPIQALLSAFDGKIVPSLEAIGFQEVEVVDYLASFPVPKEEGESGAASSTPGEDPSRHYWLTIATQITRGLWDRSDGSTRESLLIGVRSLGTPETIAAVAYLETLSDRIPPIKYKAAPKTRESAPKKDRLKYPTQRLEMQPAQPHVGSAGVMVPPPWSDDPSMPYIGPGGSLVIPTLAPARYRWWDGGISVEATRAEVLGLACPVLRKEIDWG